MRKGMKEARAKVYKSLLAPPGLKGGQRARDVSDVKVSSQRRQVAKSGYEAPEHRLKSDKIQYLQSEAEKRVPELVKYSLERAPELRAINFQKALERQTKADLTKDERETLQSLKEIERYEKSQNLKAMREHDKPGMAKKSFKKEIEREEGKAAIEAINKNK